MSKNLTIAALALTVFAISAAPANAVESQVIVDLQKKIHTNIATLQDTNKTIKDDNDRFAAQKKQISSELAKTANRQDQRYLLKLEHAVDAKALLTTAKSIKNMQYTMEEMIGNLEQWEQMNEASSANGLSSKSAEDRKIASNLMQGLAGLAGRVAAINPGSQEMVGIMEKLSYTDANMRASFNTGNGISIRKQIETLEDYHSTLAAAINLIDREKFNLNQALNLIMQGEIADGIKEISLNIAPIYKGILSGNSERLSRINEFNNGPGTPRQQVSFRDISHVGKGY